MAGILDNKSRVIDAYITQEGRRQLAQGDLRVKYVTFSDADVFYTRDAVEGAADVTNRIYLEASNLPQDQIVFEADDAGKLRPFKALSDLELAAGQLTAKVINDEDDDTVDKHVVLTGDLFSSVMKQVLETSIDNFQQLYVIGSYDTLFGEKDFAVGPEKTSFLLADEPDYISYRYRCRLSDMQSLFNDPRLSQVDNFMYLPPANKASPGEQLTAIGDYPPWSKVMDKTEAFDDLFRELKIFELKGFSRSFTFDPTSQDNNLVGQVFEIGDNAAKKLDVIHFGKNIVDGRVVDVFFVGIVVLDDNDTQSFVHMFTLVFE